MERAFDVISADEPDEDFALVAARLSLMYWTAGDPERAAERAELALDIAEANGYTRAIAIALGAKAAVAHSRGHAQEADGLLKKQLAFALEHDLADEAGSAYFILSDQAFHGDRYDDALGYLHESLVQTRRLGNRPYEWSILAEMTYALSMTGRWDEALETARELADEQTRSGGMFLSLLSGPLEIYLRRGQLDEARRVGALFPSLKESTDVQERACYFGATAALLRAPARASRSRRTRWGYRTSPSSRDWSRRWRQLSLSMTAPRWNDCWNGSRRCLRDDARRCSMPTCTDSVDGWATIAPISRPLRTGSARSASRSGARSRCSSTLS
jgi:tetratricopeptide (TPR) repeat protein